MLLTHDVLQRIFAGEVDLVFRRWKRPTVRTGGTLRTSKGMLAIVSVDQVPKASIRAADAVRAGYATKAALVAELDRRSDGRIHRIQVAPGGTDPLVQLRSDSDLDRATIGDIDARLDAMDARSRDGAWTRRYLDLLAHRPHVRAEDLAISIGIDKPTFKANVRKLKGLGLTISHSPGYELSPRGQAYRRATGGSASAVPDA